MLQLERRRVIRNVLHRLIDLGESTDRIALQQECPGEEYPQIGILEVAAYQVREHRDGFVGVPQLQGNQTKVERGRQIALLEAACHATTQQLKTFVGLTHPHLERAEIRQGIDIVGVQPDRLLSGRDRLT